MRLYTEELPLHALASLTLFLVSTNIAHAIPDAPRVFCETYPASPFCNGTEVACTMCHTAPPSINDYGGYVWPNYEYDCGDAGVVDYWSVSVSDTYCENRRDAFLAALSTGLAFAETFDSDNDGTINLVEINDGTHPSNIADVKTPPSPASGEENPIYNVDGYDSLFAYKRIWYTYCGEPASFDDVTAFSALDENAQGTELQTILASCLDSDYWKNEALHRIFDAAIRPQYAVSYDPNLQFPLADYRYDYRLASHIMREENIKALLSADYHIEEDESITEGTFNIPSSTSAGQLGQQLQTDKRAGMITTTWFLMINSMFSKIPRIAAAQAYRTYLGLDVALSKGLLPTDGEPLDIDELGIASPPCATCHNTLDPISYPFAYYNGIGGGLGEFNANRPEQKMPGTDFDNVTQSVLLDVPLTGTKAPKDVGLLGWAEVARSSEHFKRNMVQQLFEHATDRPLNTLDHDEFFSLVDNFDEQDYQVNALLSDIVQTDAFGRP
jgi:hypothetical protein